MKVLFVVHAPAAELAGGEIKLASVRYRAAMPVAELRRMGIQADLLSTEQIAAPGFALDADVVVLAQPKESIFAEGAPLGGLLKFIQGVKAAGKTLVVDVCDLKLGEPYCAYIASLHGAGVADACRRFYPALLRMADAVVTPTAALGGRLRSYLPELRNTAIVADPIEVPLGAAAFAPDIGRPLRLLWFGFYGMHAAPVSAFCRDELPALATELAPARPVRFTVMAGPEAEAPVLALGAAAKPAIIWFQAWSVPALAHALQNCDAVVLPLDYRTDSAVGKSNNRALQALYAGRPVFAHPIDSYRELAAYCSISEDLGGAIRAALADPAACLAHTKAGQDYVARHYSIQAIAQAWAEVIRR